VASSFTKFNSCSGWWAGGGGEKFLMAGRKSWIAYCGKLGG